MTAAEKKSEKKLGRPRKLENWTPELLRERADRYFSKCDDHTKPAATKDGLIWIPDPIPYSIEGLCDYLAILRHEFYSWRKRKDDLGRTAELLHQKITANRIEGALMGKQNGSFAQFMLKNNNPEDYREKVEVQSTVSEEVQSILTQWSQSWKEMS